MPLNITSPDDIPTIDALKFFLLESHQNIPSYNTHGTHIESNIQLSCEKMLVCLEIVRDISKSSSSITYYPTSSSLFVLGQSRFT